MGFAIFINSGHQAVVVSNDHDDPLDANHMPQPPPNDPLHGITLAMILERLVAHMGWQEMGMVIPIRCFTFDPSIKSSLTFLRKTPWARAKVEELYLDCLDEFDKSEDSRHSD